MDRSFWSHLEQFCSETWKWVWWMIIKFRFECFKSSFIIDWFSVPQFNRAYESDFWTSVGALGSWFGCNHRWSWVMSISKISWIISFFLSQLATQPGHEKIPRKGPFMIHVRCTGSQPPNRHISSKESNHSPCCSFSPLNATWTWPCQTHPMWRNRVSS